MNAIASLEGAFTGLATAFALAAAGYATYVAVTWLRYGRTSAPASGEDADEALDRFMPEYEVTERHHIRVAAPAEITIEAAHDIDLMHSPVIRAVFRARELVLGGKPDGIERPHGVVAFLKSLGWSVLAELPGREIVMGTVTQPWEANVVFRSVPKEEYAAFAEPEYVKIVWMARADPIAPVESLFRTETRVVTTDPVARANFRRYWACFSPGILLIRWLLLGPLRTEAERRAMERRRVTLMESEAR